MGNGAIDGARTRDNRNHNPGLYQLSYDRHKAENKTASRIDHGEAVCNKTLKYFR